MPPSDLTPAQFAEAWRAHGSMAAKVAEAVGTDVRNVYARRRRLEALGYDLPSANALPQTAMSRAAYPLRRYVEMENGTAIIFSDRHWWPAAEDESPITPAEGALLALLQQLDPDLVIANGDIYDGAGSSKHGHLGQERKPTVAEELIAVTNGMSRIAAHCRRAIKLRTVGNHDRRFDYRISQAAPEFVGVAGTRLAHHLPDWPESWSVHINPGGDGHTVVKHKLRQGVTAGRMNGMAAGTHIVTGHTHALDCVPIENYTGRKYSVQCGTLARTVGNPASEYAEDGPNAGRAGFVVLTWQAGALQPPDLVEVDDAGVAWFRGEPVTVKPRVRVRAGHAPQAR
jgi:hypothetical protein